MFCPSCGKENEDSAKFCTSCGKGIHNANQAESHSNEVPNEANENAKDGGVLDSKFGKFFQWVGAIGVAVIIIAAVFGSNGSGYAKDLMKTLSPIESKIKSTTVLWEGKNPKYDNNAYVVKVEYQVEFGMDWQDACVILAFERKDDKTWYNQSNVLRKCGEKGMSDAEIANQMKSKNWNI